MVASLRTPGTARIAPPRCACCGSPTRSRAQQVESIAHCPRCEHDVCWLDGETLHEHRRCAACEVLVGPSHATKYLINGLCSSCARAAAKGIADRDEELEESAEALLVGF
jgi:hypothetical protein